MGEHVKTFELFVPGRLCILGKFGGEMLPLLTTLSQAWITIFFILRGTAVCLVTAYDLSSLYQSFPLSILQENTQTGQESIESRTAIFLQVTMKKPQVAAGLFSVTF